MSRSRTIETRFVAIVPTQGSAYYLNGGLIQVPLDSDGYAYVAGPHTIEPADGGGEVDWNYAFETDAKAEPIRQIYRVLRSLPPDATAPGSDLVAVPRRDLAELLLALGYARLESAKQHYSAEERLDRVGRRTEASGLGEIASGLYDAGNQLRHAAGTLAVADEPAVKLAEVMPLVREPIAVAKSQE